MNKPYDITIIGSGLSGLVCAYILSKAGHKVCVLERNKQVGGCLQTFVRDRCIFDVGVHYLGGLDEGQALNQYFKYFGILDQLKLKRMDLEAFDIISFDNDPNEYALAQGYERFEAQLVEQFPKERAGIQQYLGLMQDFCRKFPLYSLDVDRSYPTNFDHLNLSARKAFESFTKDTTLQNVLAGNNILYAGDTYETPFYLHALVTNSYIESSWRCVDGGSQIARTLVRQIRRHGGDIFKQKDVDQFIFKQDEITALKMTSGEEVATKHVICSTHPHQLLRFVRHEKGRLRKSYLNRIKRSPATPSIFSAHYTLKPNTFPYINSNYYHSSKKDVWNLVEANKRDWPATYMAVTPCSSKSEVYADNIAAMTYLDYDLMKPWEDSFNTVSQQTTRGAAYEAMKEEYAEKLLQELYKRFPQLEGNVLASYASTPLSFRDYIGDPTGAFYGIERQVSNPIQATFNAVTRIPNLFLTGQNTNAHGILGVTVSALLTCFNFLDREALLKEIVAS